MNEYVAMRDKYWNERNLEEKLDGLRDTLQDLFYMIGSIHNKVEKLMMHEHNKDKIVIPVNSAVDFIHNRIPNSIKIDRV